ncbi:MAG: response regulator transcription factor [Solirubrobacteraceae bacterium]
MGAGALRVLIVDDHALYRRGLRRLLESHGLEVVGEAADARAAIRMAKKLRPDVTLMDLSMPGMPGIEAIPEIVAADPHARVLALSGGAEDETVLDALIAGACGYLMKTASTAEIVAGARLVAEGQSLISPKVAAALVVRLREWARADAQPVAAPGLTSRELEVLSLVAAGKENSAIASDLFLSPKTVKNHVAAILGKLEFDNRVQAATFAVRQGLAG